MKYIFPKGFYTDVRIEHVFSTNVKYTMRNLDECKEKRYSAAFIRLYDGQIWYYASTSDLASIQSEIDSLAQLAEKNEQIEKTKLYSKLASHQDELLAFAGQEVSKVGLNDKIELLQSIIPYAEKSPYVKLWQLLYVDEYKVKEFYNSKGAELKHDFQRSGFQFGFILSEGERQFRESYQKGKTVFSDLKDFESELETYLTECEQFMLHSESVEKGIYPVILSPMATGVFAHECFGHKSESDFMVGDVETKKEWCLGKRVGCDELSIRESGALMGNGYTLYDDEGNKATDTYLVKNGLLTGRLHHASSAADLDEEVSGNGRAINFRFEPIVRMTTTYIDKGSKTFEELISETADGIFVKGYYHGSGMSTFTLAPSLAYSIKNGKIDKPVRVSVISGNVFQALADIDGISDKLELSSFVTGGCGKMDQFPLPVGFGGPYIRVKNMNVQ